MESTVYLTDIMQSSFPKYGTSIAKNEKKPAKRYQIMTPQAERKDLRISADSGTHRYYISSKYNISSHQGSAAITTPPSPC